MGTKIKGKIVFKDVGNPAKVKEDGAPSELLLGTIIGKATDIKIAKGADGVTEFKGLRGDFEAVPADPARDTIRSGVCFLGDAFQSAIVEQLEKTDEKGNRVVQMVAFAFEVYSVKASNAAGYSWALKPLLAPAESDPLSELRAQLAAINQTAIADQTKGAAKKK